MTEDDGVTQRPPPPMTTVATAWDTRVQANRSSETQVICF